MLAAASFPLLVADIGGTNARFGWIDHASATLTHVEPLLCADFASPEEAALCYLSQFQEGRKPARVAIAIASAISDGPIKFTNNDWILDRIGFAAGIGTAIVDVFNDFEAVAMELPYLAPVDYRLVGAATPNARYSMGVIGPGTGLGVAGVVPIGGQPRAWQAICGEGGHATLAGASDYQHQILRVVRRDHAHVSAETIISGIGLPTLYRAVAEVEGLSASDARSAEEIGTLGANRADKLCTATMEAFCSLLGCVAGNLALTLGARGGIFVAGGIVPKLGEFFVQSGFREHFESKGRYIDYLRDIGTAVITTPYPGLRGLARNDPHVMSDG